MTFFKKILAAGLLSVAALSGPALAAGGHGGSHGGGWGHGGGGWAHGGGGGWGHGGGWHGGYGGYGYRSGAFIGDALLAGALLSPWYYPPYYYSSYPTVVEVSQPAPTVYIEQQQAPQPAVSADAGSWWYYCNDTRAYYPYVKECVSPWQRVSPQPTAPR